MGSTDAQSDVFVTAHPPTLAAGPHQIRSRITVVCAECKRLKLKCDRRTPCGSCTKRDTISRCIYSPAAAEKVDLHSLNNRLIQVESALAHFSASLPSGLSANNSSGALSSGHQHHHHPAAPSHSISGDDSIFSSMRDLASQWLQDFDVQLPLPLSCSHLNRNRASSTRRASLSHTGLIKLEASPADTEELSYSQSIGSAIVIDDEEPVSLPRIPSTPVRRPPNFLAHVNHQQRCSAQLLLPPLAIYYSAQLVQSTSTEAPFPSTPPFPTPRKMSVGKQPSIPRVTPALLALLPSLSKCSLLLHNAGDVFKMRPVPLAGGWIGFERRWLKILGVVEVHDQSDWAINHDVVHERTDNITFESTNGDPGGGLSFFGAVCAALALGAHIMNPHVSQEVTKEVPGFFYALGQQAMSVWDSHVGASSPTGNNSEENHDDDGNKRKVEGEKLDYLIACLISVVYLLTSVVDDNEVEKEKTMGVVFPLVGKMVNVARGMGLGRVIAKKDTKACNDDSQGVYLDTEREENKRMIWWDIVFYDLFVSDVLGHPPLIPSNSYAMKLPICLSMDEDFSESDDDEAEIQLREQHRKTRESGVESDTVPHKDRERYFGERCRFGQLAQRIKYSLAHPECCCGYTLDQASALESRVQRWLANIPQILKLPNRQFERKTDSPVLYAHCCDLVILAGILVIRIYAPFLTSSAQSQSNLTSTTPPSNSSASELAISCPTAYHAVIAAAQSVLRACLALQVVRRPPAAYGPVPPMTTDFFPLEKIIFDTITICAHASLLGFSVSPNLGIGLSSTGSSFNSSSGSLTAANPTSVISVSDDVYDGFDLFNEVNKVGGWRRKIMMALRQRLSSRCVNLLKRKHDLVGTREANFDWSVVGASIPGHEVVHEQREQRQLQKLLQPSIPSIKQHQQSRQTPSIQQDPPISPGKDAEKQKKHSKKASYHPNIGIRMRQGRDVKPLLQATLEDTSPGNINKASEDARSALHTLMASLPRPSLNSEISYTRTHIPKQVKAKPAIVAGAFRRNPIQETSSSGYSSRGSSVTQDVRMMAPDESSVAGAGTAQSTSMDFAGSFNAEIGRRYSVTELDPLYGSSPVFGSGEAQQPITNSNPEEQQHDTIDFSDSGRTPFEQNTRSSYEPTQSGFGHGHPYEHTQVSFDQAHPQTPFGHPGGHFDSPRAFDVSLPFQGRAPFDSPRAPYEGQSAVTEGYGALPNAFSSGNNDTAMTSATSPFANHLNAPTFSTPTQAQPAQQGHRVQQQGSGGGTYTGYRMGYDGLGHNIDTAPIGQRVNRIAGTVIYDKGGGAGLFESSKAIGINSVLEQVSSGSGYTETWTRAPQQSALGVGDPSYWSGSSEYFP